MLEFQIVFNVNKTYSIRDSNNFNTHLKDFQFGLKLNLSFEVKVFQYGAPARRFRFLYDLPLSNYNVFSIYYYVFGLMYIDITIKPLLLVLVH